MHLLCDWPLSLLPANALVKQSAEAIDHLHVAETRCEGGHEFFFSFFFPGRGRGKCEGKQEWGERDRLEEERGHLREKGEREREVVLGGGGCWSVEMSVAH